MVKVAGLLDYEASAMCSQKDEACNCANFKILQLQASCLNTERLCQKSPLESSGCFILNLGSI